jgi:peptide-methionine (R)-S-oxide reductase
MLGKSPKLVGKI